MQERVIGGPRRRRLEDENEASPWVRAHVLEDCFLYWLPVSGFPVRAEERAWVVEFLRRLGDALQAAAGLRCETFFQYSEITEELGNVFLKDLTHAKVTGWGRNGDAPLAEAPTAGELKEAQEKGEPADTQSWFANYLIWFLSKEPEKYRSLLSGHGGLLTIFLSPDPNTAAPTILITPKLRAAMPVFQRIDVNALVAGTYARRDRFLGASKELFGQGLEERPEYPGIPFVLPLLNSEHFFAAEAETRVKWFEVFDVYFRESRANKGLLLAFVSETHQTILHDVMRSMRDDGVLYPDPLLGTRESDEP